MAQELFDKIGGRVSSNVFDTKEDFLRFRNWTYWEEPPQTL